MRKRIALVYITFLLAGFTLPCCAIDNPDAPDYVADFQQRAKVFETAIQKNAKTTQGYLKSYADYEQFLDRELNTTYKALITKLDTAQQNKLKQSQRDWLKYRDAEFTFIADNWTSKQFGSSSVLSRGAYRTTITQDRVMLLLNYLKNY